MTEKKTRKKIDVEEDERILWVNTGGPFRTRKGRKIKTNQRFKAAEHEIPEAFRDVIHPIDELDLARRRKATMPPPEEVEIKYEIELNEDMSTDDVKLFDVMGENGKIISTSPMTEDAALKMIEDLTRA